MGLNRTLLALRSADLEERSGLASDVIGRFFDALLRASDWELFRIDAKAFATRHLLDPDDVLRLLLHGVHAGIFDMSWGALCVFCGATEHDYATLAHIPPEAFRCEQCDAPIFSFVDERIAVYFRPSSQYGKLDVDPFADLASYRRRFLSPLVARSPELSGFLARTVTGPALLRPGARWVVTPALTAGTRLRVVSQDRHTSLSLVGGGSAGAHVALGESGFVGDTDELGPSAELVVENRTGHAAGVMLMRGTAAEYESAIHHHPSTVAPFLSAQDVLASQVFRDLFRLHELPHDLALNVRNLTVVFTDLSGSTALYERLGDARAFTIVRQHFRALQGAVAAAHGAIVKSIGDAIMAVFPTPLDAARAAVAMHEAIRRLPSPPELALRVGVHTGPSLVILAEGRLDYFGRTVNVAARLEGAARPGEIAVSRAVFDAPGVARLVAPMADPPEHLSLRGVVDAVEIVRLHPPAAA